MKLIKMAMIVMASLGTLTVAIITPVMTLAAACMPVWPKFWERFFDILFRALEVYFDMVIRRGYFKVSVPADPIIVTFNSQADISAAADKGLIYDGHTLTVPQDIVLYVKDDVGVALQMGDYPLDAQRNFQFKLKKVVKPVPSPTFPIPEGSGY